GAVDLPRAAAWDGIRFDPRQEPAPPSLDPATGVIELPAATAVEWALELPADAWLAWDEVERHGSAELEVGVRREGGTERVERGESGGRARLTGESAGLVAFALRAPGGVGGVRVHGLRLHAPAAAEEAAPPRPAPPTPRPPNLIVYLVDTLRADHLGCYGYGRPTSPALDAFAGESVLFERARAQSSWTKPAVATVLTGLYPIAHGAEQRSQRLPASVETAAERLSAAGYETALFTTNANITAKFGFDQGWDEFHYLSRSRGRRTQHVSSAEIDEAVFDWLDRRDPERPFFLFVHTLDPHDPYQPEEPYRLRLAPDVDVAEACCGRSTQLVDLAPEAARERARQAGALYDAEIAQNDAAFGALLAELERRGLGDSSAVLFLSDHGEEFYDHGGWKHGWTLYEEMLRVPMVLRLPRRGSAGTRVAAPVEQIDVTPTLYNLAGVEVPSSLPGHSLLERLDGTPRPPAPAFAWLERPGLALAAAAEGGWKRIRFDGAWTPPLGRRPAELYDLSRDPRELDDL
ncbi:MAG: sulfatase, partial [Thermoleophilia bacterium]